MDIDQWNLQQQKNQSSILNRAVEKNMFSQEKRWIDRYFKLKSSITDEQTLVIFGEWGGGLICIQSLNLYRL